MEIQGLKLFVTDAHLAELLARHMPANDNIEELQARFMPEGVLVTGKYPTSFFTMTFETTWHIQPAGPELRITLIGVRVAGMPGTLLRGALMKMIRDNAEGYPGVRVDDTGVSIHVGDAATAQGVPLRVNFTSVHLSVGAAIIEAG